MRPNYGRAVAGGFIGTVVLTLMMYYVAPMMLGGPMDIARMLAPFAGGSWVGGMVLHFINGTVLFPLIYAALSYRYLPGGPAMKGAVWGLGLWFLAQAIVMPMMGGGFFSANMGGIMAVIASLLGHLVYGVTLGAIANGPEVVRTRGDSPLAQSY